MRSEIVRLTDIEPDPNNPRKEFEGLEELADSFRYTPDRPNEPFNPIIVVKDGNIYRIVDGERRYRALLLANKVDKVLCNVADTFEEAHAISMMLATDDKAPLTSTERSQGVQTMLCLGVDYEKVESLGRLKKGQAQQIKRVISNRRDHQIKPVQLDMKDLVRIASIDNPARTGELIEMLEKNPEDTGWGSEFRESLNVYKREAEGLKWAKILREIFNDLKIELHEEDPEVNGLEVERCDSIWPYESDTKEKMSGAIKGSIEEIKEEYGDEVEITAYVHLGGQIGQDSVRTRAYIYIPSQDDASSNDEVIDPAIIAEQRMKEDFSQSWDDMKERHFKWACENIDKVLKSDMGKEFTQKTADLMDKKLLKVLEKYQSVDIVPDAWMLAAFWLDYPREYYVRDCFYFIWIEKDFSVWDENAVVREISKFNSILSKLKAAGYELDEFEITLEDALETWCSGVDDESEEMSDEAA